MQTENYLFHVRVLGVTSESRVKFYTVKEIP